MSAKTKDELRRIFMLGHDATWRTRGVMAEYDWVKVPDQPVRLFVVHQNALYEPDPVQRAEDWMGWHDGKWIDFNGGGWTWVGLCGIVTHVAPTTKES